MYTVEKSKTEFLKTNRLIVNGLHIVNIDNVDKISWRDVENPCFNLYKDNQRGQREDEEDEVITTYKWTERGRGKAFQKFYQSLIGLG